MITVELGEILRHLALPESVIERIVNELWLNAEARSLIAIDDDADRRAKRLLVARDIPQFGQSLQLRQDQRGPMIQFRDVGMLQRILILGAARPSADIQLLRRLHEKRHALKRCGLFAQPRNDLIRRSMTFTKRFQADSDKANVRCAGANAADRRGPAPKIR